MVFSQSKAVLDLRDSQLGTRGSIRSYLERGSQNTEGSAMGLQLCLELGVLKDIWPEGRVVISGFLSFGVSLP